MAIMAMDTKANPLLFIIAFNIISTASYAGDWEFKPAVNITETYSDNLELSSSNETSGLVSQAGVDLSASYKAQNSSLNLSSQSTYASYSNNHDLDNDFHTLEADSKLLLWPNGVTLTASASIRNRSKNSARNALAGIVSADTVRTENYRSGLEYQIKNRNHSLNTQATYSTSKSADKIGENEGVTFLLSSSNGSDAKNIFWDSEGRYSKRKNSSRDSQQHRAELKIGVITRYNFSPFIRYYDEDNTGSVNRRQTSLNTNSYGFGFRWQPITRLIIDASYNEPLDDALDTSNQKQEAYLDFSIDWQPSSRTKIQATLSQRFYGDSYGLNITHANRRLTNTISYNEQIQSFNRDNYQILTSTFLCLNPNATSISDCFVQSGDNFNPADTFVLATTELIPVEDDNYWLNKTLRWSSILTLPRTTFSLNIDNSQRENLNSNVSNETRSIKIGADRKLSPNSKIGFSASYNERNYGQDSENEQSDKYRRYGINFNNKLNQALVITMDVDHINRSSNNERYNYSENRIALRLTKDF